MKTYASQGYGDEQMYFKFHPKVFEIADLKIVNGAEEEESEAMIL